MKRARFAAWRIVWGDGHVVVVVPLRSGSGRKRASSMGMGLDACLEARCLVFRS
jgi:hypothetical protein